MGNALDFLKMIEGKEKKKEELRANIKSSPKITQCPNASISGVPPDLQISGWSKGQGAVCDLPRISARMKAKRKTKQCACCGQDFKSNATRMPSGQYHYSRYCDKCSGTMHGSKRKIVEQMGSYDAYLSYLKRKERGQLNQRYPLSVIQEEYDFRKKYNLPTKRIKKILELKLLAQKIEDEKYKNSSVRDEEDYDF